MVKYAFVTDVICQTSSKLWRGKSVGEGKTLDCDSREGCTPNSGHGGRLVTKLSCLILGMEFTMSVSQGHWDY